MYVRLGLPSGVLPWGFSPKSYTHFPPVCDTFTHPSQGPWYESKLCSSSFRCLLQRDAIFHPLRFKYFPESPALDLSCVCSSVSARYEATRCNFMCFHLCAGGRPAFWTNGNNRPPNKTLIIEPPSSSKPHRNVEFFTPTSIAPCARRLGTQFFLGGWSGGASPLFSSWRWL